ncbi:MAG: Gliding motility-associated protein GldL [Segetibacter sp.]|nr:Gliding motility-associated protein GldL [Segetibacter sp.]
MSSGVSPATNRLVNVVVCLGAAVVIFGAWAKILHKSFADIMLTVGLLTEAVIFIIYAILPPPDAGAPSAPVVVENSKGNPALKSMEKMLEDADITPANLTKLSAGFQKLGTTVTSMSEIGDVVKATGDYATKTRAAAAALDTVKDAYVNTANSLSSFNAASESTRQFHDQVQVLTKNLSSLNTIYELELQESNNHLKALNQFYGKLAQASNAMSGSVEDAKKAQEQIAMLANNLGRLNSVYGNMLSAMQGR